MDLYGKLAEVYFIEGRYQIFCIETPHGEFCSSYFNFYSFLYQFMFSSKQHVMNSFVLGFHQIRSTEHFFQLLPIMLSFLE